MVIAKALRDSSLEHSRQEPLPPIQSTTAHPPRPIHHGPSTTAHSVESQLYRRMQKTCLSPSSLRNLAQIRVDIVRDAFTATPSPLSAQAAWAATSGVTRFPAPGSQADGSYAYSMQLHRHDQICSFVLRQQPAHGMRGPTHTIALHKKTATDESMAAAGCLPHGGRWHHIAEAPPTTSRISWVIAAWRALL